MHIGFCIIRPERVVRGIGSPPNRAAVFKKKSYFIARGGTGFLKHGIPPVVISRVLSCRPFFPERMLLNGFDFGKKPKPVSCQEVRWMHNGTIA